MNFDNHPNIESIINEIDLSFLSISIAHKRASDPEGLADINLIKLENYFDSLKIVHTRIEDKKKDAITGIELAHKLFLLNEMALIKKRNLSPNWHNRIYVQIESGCAFKMIYLIAFLMKKIYGNDNASMFLTNELGSLEHSIEIKKTTKKSLKLKTDLTYMATQNQVTLDFIDLYQSKFDKSRIFKPDDVLQLNFEKYDFESFANKFPNINTHKNKKLKDNKSNLVYRKHPDWSNKQINQTFDGEADAAWNLD